MELLQFYSGVQRDWKRHLSRCANKKNSEKIFNDIEEMAVGINVGERIDNNLRFEDDTVGEPYEPWKHK